MRLVLRDKFNVLKGSYSKWCAETVIAHKLLFSLTMAYVTGLATQIRFPLFFTPVPITGQTLVVLLSGVMLGSCYGGLSQIFYIAMGVSGIFWFAGWSSGLAYLAGPTGGYIIGFVAAAFFIGQVTTDKSKTNQSFYLLFFYMLLANFLLIHTIGLIQLYLWLHFVKNTPTSLIKLISMGSLPFVPGDIAKAAIAAGIAKVIRGSDRSMS